MNAVQLSSQKSPTLPVYSTAEAGGNVTAAKWLLPMLGMMMKRFVKEDRQSLP